MKQYKYICNKCNAEVYSEHPHDYVICTMADYNTSTGHTTWCHGICERQYVELLEFADFEPLCVN